MFGTEVGTPSVSDGVVYVTTAANELRAFDALGDTNCSGSPKTCTPLWSAALDGSFVASSSPAVAGGVVYVANGITLHAFDAVDTSDCSGIPTPICTPLWTGIQASTAPVVANGLAYSSSASLLTAFDAAGVNGCSGDPKECTPLLNRNTGSFIRSSLAIARGRVYFGSEDNRLHVYALP
jgi:outer membrane protein assembly factor BamB